MAPVIPASPATDNQIGVLLLGYESWGQCLEVKFDALAGFYNAQ